MNKINTHLKSLKPTQRLRSRIPHITKKLQTKEIIIYTDGACSNNGKTDAVVKAGVGVYFGKGDSRNISEPLFGRPTNQRAELVAAIRALQVVEMTEADLSCVKVVLYSDSRYVVKGITDWIVKWEALDYVRKGEKPVLNDELWRELRWRERRIGEVCWVHCKAHVGIEGNEAADELAREGIEK